MRDKQVRNRIGDSSPGACLLISPLQGWYVLWKTF